MKNMVGIFVWVLLALVLQTTLASQFCFFLSRITGIEVLSGATFDLALVTLSYLVIRRNLAGAFLWTALLGVAVGSFGLGWKGAQAASYFAVAFLGQISRRSLLIAGMGGFTCLVALFTLAEGALHLYLGSLFSQIPQPFDGQFSLLVTQIILNAAVSPVVFTILSIFDQWTMERSYRAYGLAPL